MLKRFFSEEADVINKKTLFTQFHVLFIVNVCFVNFRNSSNFFDVWIIGKQSRSCLVDF